MKIGANLVKRVRPLGLIVKCLQTRMFSFMKSMSFTVVKVIGLNIQKIKNF